MLAMTVALAVVMPTADEHDVRAIDGPQNVTIPSNCCHDVHDPRD